MNLILAHFGKKCIIHDIPLLGKNVKKCTFSKKLVSKTATVVTLNKESPNKTAFALFVLKSENVQVRQGLIYVDLRPKIRSTWYKFCKLLSKTPLFNVRTKYSGQNVFCRKKQLNFYSKSSIWLTIFLLRLLEIVNLRLIL